MSIEESTNQFPWHTVECYPVDYDFTMHKGVIVDVQESDKWDVVVEHPIECDQLKYLERCALDYLLMEEGWPDDILEVLQANTGKRYLVRTWVEVGREPDDVRTGIEMHPVPFEIAAVQGDQPRQLSGEEIKRWMDRAQEGQEK